MQTIILGTGQDITDRCITKNGVEIGSALSPQTLQAVIESDDDFFYGSDDGSARCCSLSVTEITLSSGSVTFEAFVGGRPTKPPKY